LRKELPSESVPDLSAILRKAKLGRLRIISPLSKVVGYRCCRRTDVDHRGETFEPVVPAVRTPQVRTPQAVLGVYRQALPGRGCPRREYFERQELRHAGWCGRLASLRPSSVRTRGPFLAGVLGDSSTLTAPQARHCVCKRLKTRFAACTGDIARRKEFPVLFLRGPRDAAGSAGTAAGPALPTTDLGRATVR